MRSVSTHVDSHAITMNDSYDHGVTDYLVSQNKSSTKRQIKVQLLSDDMVAQREEDKWMYFVCKFHL